MANSEPHPLDPDSKLNPEERLVFRALMLDRPIGFGDDPGPWDWARAVTPTTIVTNLHVIGAHVEAGDPLPDRAHARRSDPAPSQIAAASIDNMAERHRAVLQVARTFADVFTHDELVHRYNARRENRYVSTFVEDLPHMEPQSIRSRCAELRRAGWIEQAGRALSDAGRTCNTWRVVK
jgi:hypothetical protein